MLDFVLPFEKNFLKLNGNGGLAIFFSNDHKFNLSRLISLFYSRIIKSLNELKNINSEENFNIDDLLEECLKKLWVTHCRDATQFKISIDSLPRRLEIIKSEQNQVNIPIVLLVDSIDSFYWLGKSSDIYGHENVFFIYKINSHF